MPSASVIFQSVTGHRRKTECVVSFVLNKRPAAVTVYPIYSVVRCKWSYLRETRWNALSFYSVLKSENDIFAAFNKIFANCCELAYSAILKL